MIGVVLPTYKLTVYISTDGDGASNRLNVRLFHEDLPSLKVSTVPMVPDH